FAKFIDDHRVFLAVGFGEYAVEQGRLAGPEIAGQHRHRDLFRRRLLGHFYLLAFWRLGPRRLLLAPKAQTRSLLGPSWPWCSGQSKIDNGETAGGIEFRSS